MHATNKHTTHNNYTLHFNYRDTTHTLHYPSRTATYHAVKTLEACCPSATIYITDNCTGETLSSADWLTVYRQMCIAYAKSKSKA